MGSPEALCKCRHWDDIYNSENSSEVDIETRLFCQHKTAGSWISSKNSILRMLMKVKLASTTLCDISDHAVQCNRGIGYILSSLNKPTMPTLFSKWPYRPVTSLAPEGDVSYVYWQEKCEGCAGQGSVWLFVSCCIPMYGPASWQQLHYEFYKAHYDITTLQQCNLL